MAQAREEFQKAVADILEVAMFENWLRFYFIKEEPGDEQKLRIELPQKSAEKIKELYPALWPLAEAMANRPVDFETSRRAVLSFILDHLDGVSMPRDMPQKVFSSQTFQTRLQLFHAWAQMHEEQLDRGFLEFGAWRDLFNEWLRSKGARELAQKLS